ncbi:tRNA lysidine(34) synthetase TilS [Exiguobacterium algae]|uniref:tRNA lysidine(34) synthetase TilS n=1 Tax=Exiguobacterium algae TaxID=2751250 RepID=UPI001BE995D2|nr:tRNA lysidine(34) synthetase TilS [Exiguobacterium algae]
MKKVLVAVSGGVDSVVLLDYLVKKGWDVGVAHVHHGLRSESDEEYEFVSNLSRSYDVPFHGKRLTFPDGGSQAIYRKERYRFFEELMDHYGYGAVATAHHADDELETVLIQLHRNMVEVKGILRCRPFGSGELIRPLLNETKQSLLTYAASHQLEWREDQSNQDDTYLRNQIRHRIIPRLKEVWPDIVQKVSDAAEIQKKLWEERYAFCRRWVEEYVDLEMKAFHVKLKDYSTLSDLEKYTVGRLLSMRYQVEVGEGIERLFASTKSTAFYDVSDRQFFRKRNGVLSLLEREREDIPAHHIIEEIPARIQFGKQVITFWKEEGTYGIPLDDIQFPLTVRTAQQGDRIRLRIGTKKVSRIFIDEKIDRLDRPRVPLIVDATGRVIAIVGIRVSDFVDKSDAICLRLMVK